MKKKTKDYYSILGIEKSATPEEIKKAYRQKALKHHPDKNPNDKGAEDRFKEINEAYEVLSDPDKKSHYDQFGVADMGSSGFRDPRDIFVNFEGFGDDPEFQEIISRMRGMRGMNGMNGFQNFGFGFPGNSANRIRQNTINPDIRASCNISLSDVISGTEVVMQVTRAIACETCKTTGVDTSKEFEKCEVCGGRGMRIGKMQGNMIIQQTCGACSGTGKKIQACKKCNGDSYTTIEEKLSVKIPKGIPPMATLRLKNKGNVTYKGDYKIEGNLFVIIDYPIEENGIAINNGEIFATIKVPFTHMICGERIAVNLFNCKKILFTLDPHKPSGYKYEVKDGGIVDGKSAYIKVFADFPQNEITEENRQKLIKTLKEVYGDSTTTFKPESI